MKIPFLFLSLIICLSACGPSEKTIRSTLEAEVAVKVADLARATVQSNQTKMAATITAFKYPTNTPFPTYTPGPTYTPYATYTLVNTPYPKIYFTQVIVTITNTPTKTTIPTQTAIPTRTLIPPTEKPQGQIIRGNGFFIVGKDIIQGYFYEYLGGGSDNCIIIIKDHDLNNVAGRTGHPELGFFVPDYAFQITLMMCGDFQQRLEKW